jgi:hypothetical protein
MTIYLTSDGESGGMYRVGFDNGAMYVPFSGTPAPLRDAGDIVSAAEAFGRTKIDIESITVYMVYGPKN